MNTDYVSERISLPKSRRLRKSKWIRILHSSGLALMIAACAVPVAPTSTAPPAPSQTPEPRSPTASSPPLGPTPVPVKPTSTGTPWSPTETAVPTPTGTPFIIPTAHPPTSTLYPEAEYTLLEEVIVGAYAVRLWQDTTPISAGFVGVATISAYEQEDILIEEAESLGELTGTDITGDEIPEAIIQSYSGGAHCCFTTTAYSLGDQPEQILALAGGDCSGEFQDLNGDGVYEFVTCDDRFAYAFCAYAGSPLVQVVLKYEPDQGYVPASPEYAEEYAADIEAHLELAENGGPGEMGEWDGTTKCSVLPLVLDYLYSGEPETAWSELARLYTTPDAAEFQTAIEDIVAASPLYAPPDAG